MSHLSGPQVIDYRERNSNQFSTINSSYPFSPPPSYINPNPINPNPINQNGYVPGMQGEFQTPNPYWKNEELRGSQAERQARFE